jgi:hypothetical protein
MTNAHVVSRSPSSIEIGFKGRDFADAYKVFIDPNLDRATLQSITRFTLQQTGQRTGRGDRFPGDPSRKTFGK